MAVVFVDTETTGLDPERHEVWDIALIEEDGTEHEWHIEPHHLRSADPSALRLTHFYERIKAAGPREVTREVPGSYPRRAETRKEPAFWTDRTRRSIAREIASLTANRHLVGAIPWFDAAFLSNLLMSEEIVPAWHYHMVDVETLVAGKLGIAPPWDSDLIALELGIEGDPLMKHMALGDARWAKTIYDAVLP